jgi:hypothetical protein
MTDSFWIWTLWLMLLIGLGYAVYSLVTTDHDRPNA